MKARARAPDQPLRCAIYTRKSSEEGLDQEYNSLHAQRDACEAYVRSQAGEGWRLAPGQYDDGGFSGGNIERPGLKRGSRVGVLIGIEREPLEPRGHRGTAIAQILGKPCE